MKEKLEKIIVNSEEFQSLSVDIQNDKLAKTLMLVSKDSEYSFEFAKLLACLILNGGLKEGQLDKNENYYKINALSHPDVKIYPLKDKLYVSDSEEIVYESFVKPIFAEQKVFIIKNIEQGMEVAQNKLLKTLEEPQNNVYYILTTSNINLVLPTIRSRCNKITLSKLKNVDIGSLIESKDKDIIIALSEGNIGQAEKLSRLNDLNQIFNNILNVVTKLKSSKEVIIYSRPLIDNIDNFELILKTLSLIFEDILMLKSGGQKLRFDFIRSTLENCCNDYTMKAIVEIQTLLTKASREFGYNCNAVLIIENLLLNILEVKYLCK